MKAPFPKSGIPSMIGDQMGSSTQAQQAQLSQALSSMSDEELMGIINSNPEVKKQYDELLSKHAKDFDGKKAGGLGLKGTKPLTTKEYYKIEKELEKHLDSEGGIVIEPEPRFVYKTFESKTQEKFFINIVTHPLIDMPEEKYMVDYENQPGLRVPMSLGRLKEDSDKKGEVCKVVDAIVNPKVAETLETDVGLAQFFVQLLQSYCEQKYKIGLSEKFLTPKLKYKGQSVEVQRVKGKKAPKIMQLSKEDNEAQEMIAKSGKKLVEEMTSGGAKQPIATGLIPRPKWSLSLIDRDGGEEEYDGDFVLANLKLLKLKVEMPLLVTGKHIQLQVSSSRIYIRNGKYYELSLRLPVKIEATSVATAFSTSKRILIITLKPEKKKIAVQTKTAEIETQVEQPTQKTSGMQLTSNMLDDLV